MSAVRAAFWNSRVAVQLSLSEDDVSAAGRPPSLFVALPYVAPLSVTFSGALSSLREFLPPGPSAPWVSAGHLPLRWEYPVGVLRDLVLLAGDPLPGTTPLSPPPLSPLPPHSPWRLTFHARHAEDVGLAPWRDDDSTRASLMNGLKQASFIVRGSAARVMELSRGASADLARAAAEGDVERDRAVRAGLALDPVPVRGRPARAPVRILVRTFLGARRGDARAAASPLITWSDVAVTSRGVPVMTTRAVGDDRGGESETRCSSGAASRAAGRVEGDVGAGEADGSLAHSRAFSGLALSGADTATEEDAATGEDPAAAADSASPRGAGARAARGGARAEAEAEAEAESARVQSAKAGASRGETGPGGEAEGEANAGAGEGTSVASPVLPPRPVSTEEGARADAARVRGGEDGEGLRGGGPGAEGSGEQSLSASGEGAVALRGIGSAGTFDENVHAIEHATAPRSPSAAAAASSGPPSRPGSGASASLPPPPPPPPAPRAVEAPTTLLEAVSAFLDELDGVARAGTLPRARCGEDPRVASLIVGGVRVPGGAPVGGVHAALHAPDGFLYIVVGRWPKDSE